MLGGESASTGQGLDATGKQIDKARRWRRLAAGDHDEALSVVGSAQVGFLVFGERHRGHDDTVGMHDVALRVTNLEVDTTKPSVPKHAIPGGRREGRARLAVGLLALPPA